MVFAKGLVLHTRSGTNLRQIASRLWHEPFSVLIDATCYSGKNDPKDDFFKMLDLLMPCEVSQNLTRIYIYNMNSAFKYVHKMMSWSGSG